MSPLELSIDDIEPFSDLGTSIEASGSRFSLSRNGQRVDIALSRSGYIIETADSSTQYFDSPSALLASPTLANLARIARNQAVLLAPERVAEPIPVHTDFRGVVGSSAAFVENAEPWQSLDLWLRSQKLSQNPNGTDILLLNGPAGVGKTTIVREVALLRAEQYNGSSPLIVQISSRGRVLQNISDLIAFSLQDIRSNLTIDQLVSLIRHGLIVLAIDGFDELSDPNGFETAWSGLNSIISRTKGNSTFILAGRETFISTEIIQRQLKFFDINLDRLSTLNIDDPDPIEARKWILAQDGWSYDLLNREFVEPLFVEGSYALRPFFLDVIRREPIALASDSPPASDLLSYLVEVMTEREGDKFVESLDPPDESRAIETYKLYIVRYLEELARDMAENQTDSIAIDALDLIAAVAADGILPDEQVPALVQRARTVVFLANDLRPGYVRFAHEQLQQHFLAREALRSVGEGETPRYIRRNHFGREALEVFAHVARGHEADAMRFLSAARLQMKQPTRDRANTNLAVLGIAAACATAPDDAGLVVKDTPISELFFPFAAPAGISLLGTTVSLLHAAGADLRTVAFDSGCHIVTLEVDQATLLSRSMPLPQTLVHPGGTTSSPVEIRVLISRVDEQTDKSAAVWPADLAELLGRIDRYRTFWLRTNVDDADPPGRRIILHPDWPSVYQALRDLGLVTVRMRQAAGTQSEFIHFRQTNKLSENGDLRNMLLG
jgi:hypothetical protein